MSAKVDMSCDLNEALNITDVVTSDGTARGNPIPITGWTLRAVIHKRLGDGTPLKTYTTGGGGITIPVGTDGQLKFTITNADVLALGVGDFRYYIARVDAGAEKNLTEGAFSIYPI